MMGTGVIRDGPTPRLENAVRERRMARCWSADELAVYAGVSPSAVRLIERDAGHNPTADTMLKLAAALECDLGDLFWSAPEDGTAA